MYVKRIFLDFGNLIRRKPLLFNSIIYGSFYTGAEFAQQTYNRNYNQREVDETNIRERFIDKGLTEATRNRVTNNEQLSDNSIRAIIADYDWPTLQRYATYGCFIAGPILHGWYKWLDNSLRGTAMRTVIVKLAVDQFILTPPLLVLFFTSMSCMERREDIFQECKMKFIKTFQTSCFYWLPVQFLNFLVIPPAFRVVYVSVAAFCWVNILCYLKRMPLPSSDMKVSRLEK